MKFLSFTLHTALLKAALLPIAFVGLFYASQSSAEQGAKARDVDQIKKSGEIVIGVFSDRAPFDYVDNNGDYKGFNIAYGDRIAKDLGVKPKYVSVETASRAEYLVTAKVDIILADFTVTEERSKVVDFALPYMKASIGVVSPDKALIKDVKDLYDGKTLIVTKGSITESYFHNNHPQVKLLKFAHTADTYNALLDGRADALAADNTEVLAWAVENKGYTAGIQSLGDVDIIAAAVQKGNKSLLDWLNNHIKELGKEQFFHKAYKETLEPFYGTTVSADTIVIEGGVY